MAVTVTCVCGATYRLGDDKCGKRVKCKQCEAMIPVPMESDTAERSESQLDDELLKLLPPRVSSAKRRAKRSTDDDRTEQPRDFVKWGLWIGGAIGAGLLLVGIGCLLFGAPGVGGLLVTAVLFVAGIFEPYMTDLYKRRIIREDIEHYGGSVRGIRSADYWWLPRPLAQSLYRFDRSPRHELYEVSYSDRDGQARKSYCKVSLFSGTAWDDDPSAAVHTQEWSRGTPMIAAIALGLLVVTSITASAIYVEFFYSFGGQATIGRVTSAEWMGEHARLNRRPNTTRSSGGGYLKVTYIFREPDGTERTETCAVTSVLFTDLKRDDQVKVEFLPGYKGWSRLKGANRRMWVMVVLVVGVLLGAFVVITSVLDSFDALGLKKPSRRSKRAGAGVRSAADDPDEQRGKVEARRRKSE